MPDPTTTQLAALLEPLVAKPGMTQTPVPGVELMRATECLRRHPIVYTPRIIVVAQGQKRIFLGDKTYVYDANNYLVVSAPMPVECETTASEEEPLLGFVISVDPILVGEILLEMGDVPAAEPKSALSSTAITADVIDASIRLAKALASPVDARILGPQIVREIVYRVLLGEKGEVLRLLTSSGTRYGQIARVLRRIHQDFAEELDVDSLAREANMGMSTFHHAFREVTANSPVQYIKQVRLHRARALLTMSGLTAQEASRSVGYVSPSQFSREYKRMFGTTPSEDRVAEVA